MMPSGRYTVTSRRGTVSRYSVPSLASAWPMLVWPLLVSAALLPAPALQAEVAKENCRQQKRHHGIGDRRALAEVAAGDGTLERQRCHQMRGIDRPAAREH